MKNGYRITDAHAHVFPDKIAEKATEGISHFYDLPMEYHGRVAEMLENGMAVSIGRLREDTLFDYKFACMSHNTLRGAAGGAVLLAELLAAKGYFD